MPEGSARVTAVNVEDELLDRPYVANWLGVVPATLARWEPQGRGPECLRVGTWFVIAVRASINGCDRSPRGARDRLLPRSWCASGPDAATETYSGPDVDLLRRSMLPIIPVTGARKPRSQADPVAVLLRRMEQLQWLL